MDYYYDDFVSKGRLFINIYADDEMWIGLDAELGMFAASESFSLMVGNDIIESFLWGIMERKDEAGNIRVNLMWSGKNLFR